MSVFSLEVITTLLDIQKLWKKSIFLNRKHYYIVEFAQRPKQLKKYILDVLGESDDINVLNILKKQIHLLEILLGLETSNNLRIEEKMKSHNFKFMKLEPDDTFYSYFI